MGSVPFQGEHSQLYHYYKTGYFSPLTKVCNVLFFSSRLSFRASMSFLLWYSLNKCASSLTSFYAFKSRFNERRRDKNANDCKWVRVFHQCLLEAISIKIASCSDKFLFNLYSTHVVRCSPRKISKQKLKIF